MSKNWCTTKKGPGRTSVCNFKHYRPNPAGTKLVKAFIKNATGEAIAYRRTLAELTGIPLNEPT